MKLVFIFFVLFSAGFAYSQNFRPVPSKVQSEISVCASWENRETQEKHTGYNVCSAFQICSIQPYTTKEPVVVSCDCTYTFGLKRPVWTSNGVHLDENTAEEEARNSCILRSKYEDAPITILTCGVRYRYLCEDGSVVMNRGIAQSIEARTDD